MTMLELCRARSWACRRRALGRRVGRSRREVSGSTVVVGEAGGGGQYYEVAGALLNGSTYIM